MKAKPKKEPDKTLPPRSDLPPHTSMEDVFARIAKNYDEEKNPDPELRGDHGSGGGPGMAWPIAEFESEIKAHMKDALSKQDQDAGDAEDDSEPEVPGEEDEGE